MCDFLLVSVSWLNSREGGCLSIYGRESRRGKRGQITHHSFIGSVNATRGTSALNTPRALFPHGQPLWNKWECQVNWRSVLVMILESISTKPSFLCKLSGLSIFMHGWNNHGFLDAGRKTKHNSQSPGAHQEVVEPIKTYHLDDWIRLQMSDGNKWLFEQLRKNWTIICSLVDAVPYTDQYIIIDKSFTAFNGITLDYLFLACKRFAFFL